MLNIALFIIQFFWKTEKHTATERLLPDWCYLKHTTTLFYLSDHNILSQELLLIKYRLIIRVGIWCCNQSGVTELLIMRNPHYGRMCFKSAKTLGDLHSQLWKRPRPSAWTFSVEKNIELLNLYPILNTDPCLFFVGILGIYFTLIPAYIERWPGLCCF